MKNFIANVKNNKAGLVIGAFFLIVSLIASAFTYWELTTDGRYHPKILYIGTTLLPISVAVLFFQGYPKRINEYTDQNVDFAEFWQNSPKLHRVVWTIAMLIGVALVVYIENHILN
ncbi:MAG: hypothetical protein RIS47_458 [Bacteroidota bacterium]|jgi:heme/copper-type cytochrome/quinol oxidase subunit 1